MGVLRVATYNVHGCVGTDGKEDRDRIGNVIEELQADVIGLQELNCRTRCEDGMDQLDHLALRTGLQGVPGPTVREGLGYFGNGLLTRLPVERVEYTDVSVPGREPRGVIHARVLMKSQAIEVAVTHFGLRASERRRQVNDLLRSLPPSPSTPLVVLGDFNEWHPRAESLSRLDQAFGKSPRLRTFPSFFPVFALDRVWATPPASIEHVAPHRSPQSRVASDHLPVVADIRV
ncbi:MAG: endonuclease/exonuclease/phosphatase family protein [Myxococcales bacterium]|nr:endonuclease/exonuclease/phosphatase family protein [Myxococcales bacterium]